MFKLYTNGVFRKRAKDLQLYTTEYTTSSELAILYYKINM